MLQRPNISVSTELITMTMDTCTGRYQKTHAEQDDSGDYMFSVGTRNIIKKSFGKVSVMIKQGLVQ